MNGEKARWELHKNAMYCFEQILEVTPHKTVTPISKTIEVRWTRQARHC